MASIGLLTVVAIDRYLSICRPDIGIPLREPNICIYNLPDHIVILLFICYKIDKDIHDQGLPCHLIPSFITQPVILVTK